VPALGVRTTTVDDEIHVVDTVVLAFSGDPFVRWFYPGGHDYLVNMPEFTRAFGGNAFNSDGAFCTDDYVGAALWFRPGIHPDEEAVGAVVERSVSKSVQEELFAVLEQMSQYHPDEPHWYLPIIGVDPGFQDKGYGSALMAHVLQRVDEGHVPAYLESSNPRNISLYKRHGFEVLATIQEGTSPPVVPMLRSAR
tara:strand:+ start:2446 stop:3030 length:585 start_codon:yes stop_codon:yes gene_type:complete